MDNERRIGSLYARRRRLILGLQDFDRRAEVYRLALSELELELRALRPFVPPFKPRKTDPYFTAEEFIRAYHDATRQADGRVLTIDDVVTILMRGKDLDVADVVVRKRMRHRVVATRRRLRQRNSSL